MRCLVNRNIANELTAVAGDIVKTDPAKRLAMGWAYVTHDAEGVVNMDKPVTSQMTLKKSRKTSWFRFGLNVNEISSSQVLGTGNHIEPRR